MTVRAKEPARQVLGVSRRDAFAVFTGTERDTPPFSAGVPAPTRFVAP
jgi:hypothetical protein